MVLRCGWRGAVLRGCALWTMRRGEGRGQARWTIVELSLSVVRFPQQCNAPVSAVATAGQCLAQWRQWWRRAWDAVVGVISSLAGAAQRRTRAVTAVDSAVSPTLLSTVSEATDRSDRESVSPVRCAHCVPWRRSTAGSGSERPLCSRRLRCRQILPFTTSITFLLSHGISDHRPSSLVYSQIGSITPRSSKKRPVCCTSCRRAPPTAPSYQPEWSDTSPCSPARPPPQPSWPWRTPPHSTPLPSALHR